MDINNFNWSPFAGQCNVSVLPTDVRKELGLKMWKEKRCDRSFFPNTNGLISEPLTICYELWTGGCVTLDLLDFIREDAMEDFDRNGVERELDEEDRIMIKLRNNSGCSDPTSSLVPYHVEPVEYVSPSKGMPGSKKKKQKALKSYCVFCKYNGEKYDVYSTHILKVEDGKVRCPILRMYTCPVCKVNGDNAHTLRYCPKTAEKKMAAARALMSARPSNKEKPRGRKRHKVPSKSCSDPTSSLVPYHVEPVDYVSPSKCGRGSKKKKQKGLKSYCVFCKNNGEKYDVYSTHILKYENGKVRCPILRMYTYPVCKANGDNAHTLRYCPKTAEKKMAAERPLVSARPSNKEKPRGRKRNNVPSNLVLGDFILPNARNVSKGC